MALTCASLLAAGSAVERASAQARDQPPAHRPGHLTISGGMGWTGGYEIGDAAAELRGNGVGANAPPFVLFTTSSSLQAAAGPEARVGVAVTRGLTVEAGVSYQRPTLRTDIGGDAETPALTIDAERVSQYIIEAGVTWQVPGFQPGGRLRPFVSGAAGYLRQLYDERTIVETGRVYLAGGGVRYWLRGGDGVRRSAGFRGDVRAMWRQDGVEFEGKTRVAPAASVHVFVEF